jgi:hypothetical protein
MTALLVGYARCSTEQQDLTAQREGLLALGVDPARVYVDHGLTGTNRERPGLRLAAAARFTGHRSTSGERNRTRSYVVCDKAAGRAGVRRSGRMIGGTPTPRGC